MALLVILPSETSSSKFSVSPHHSSYTNLACVCWICLPIPLPQREAQVLYPRFLPLLIQPFLKTNNDLADYITTSLTCFLFSARVAVAQSSSLNLFANRDVELEQRAMLLKRLAFAIFSSEIDQYQKYLPDIQGKQWKLFYLPSKLEGFLFLRKYTFPKL